MIKPLDYFRKFEGMKPNGEAELPLDGGGKRKILWLSDNVTDETALGKAMVRSMGVMLSLPDDVYVQYAACDEALDELTKDCCLVVFDHGLGHRYQGYPALKKVVDSGSKVPRIYTCTDMNELQQNQREYIEKNTDCSVSLTELGNLVMNIMKYIKK